MHEYPFNHEALRKRKTLKLYFRFYELEAIIFLLLQQIAIIKLFLLHSQTFRNTRFLLINDALIKVIIFISFLYQMEKMGFLVVNVRMTQKT